MKKRLALLLAFLLMVYAFAGCGGQKTTPSDQLDDTLSMLELDFSRYLDENDIPKSVLDTLDMMLDHFVSGLSRPAPSDIPVSQVDPGDTEGQSLIAETQSTVTSEAELEALILKTMQNLETEVNFEATPGWISSFAGHTMCI